MKNFYHFFIPIILLFSPVYIYSQTTYNVTPDITDVSCNGGNDGSIDLTIYVNPPTYSFQFSWSNGYTTEDLNNLIAGIYYVTIEDGSGFYYTDSFTVSEPNSINVTSTIINASTLGGGDGSINLTISGGTSPYVNFWSTGETTTSLISLTAGIYSVTFIESTGCEYINSYNIESPLPQGWEVEVTSFEHVFYIETDSLVIVNNSSLALGSLIGVFYLENNHYYCAGYTFWNQATTQITAYIDGGNSGVGAPLYSDVYYKVFDITTNHEYLMAYEGSVPVECVEYTTGTVSECHIPGLSEVPGFNQFTLNLPSGWSIFGIPLLADNISIDSIFAPIINQIKVIKDDKGHVFWPQYNVDLINEIDFREGYQINMLSSQSLLVTGTPVFPAIVPLTFPQGWSMFGYYRSTPIDVMILFDPWMPCFELFKTDMGYIYWPQFNIDYPYYLLPGKGYMVYFSCPYTIYLPPNI